MATFILHYTKYVAISKVMMMIKVVKRKANQNKYKPNFS